MGFQGTLFWNKSIWQLQVVKYHNCGENYASIEWACSNLFNQPRDVPSKPADPLIVALSFQLVKRCQKYSSNCRDPTQKEELFPGCNRCCFHVDFQVSIFFSIDFWGLLYWKVTWKISARNLPGSTWPAAQLVRSHSSQPKIQDALQISFHRLCWILLDFFLYTTKIYPLVN